MKIAALLVICVVLLATSTDARSAAMERIMAKKSDIMTAENMARFKNMNAGVKGRIMEMYKNRDIAGMRAMKDKMTGKM